MPDRDPAQTSSTDCPKPRKSTGWRPRYSMRGLLIAVTIYCVALGWRLNRAHQQREAVKAIREAGGWVYYDFQQYDPKTGKFDSQAAPSAPAWMLDPVGIDFWHNVTALNMSFHEEQGKRWDNKKPAVNIAPQLAHLPHLRFLGVTEHAVDDAGLQRVGQLKQLEVLLYWDAPGITDDGAIQFHDMPRLRYLGMSSSEVGDRGVAAFAKLRGLEHLTLQGNNLTDEGLASLAGHPRLKSLWVGGLRERPSKITDAGVLRLATIPSLEELDLQNTQVTLAGLKPLQQLPALKNLYLNGSTADDLDAASAMFPNCQVSANKKALVRRAAIFFGLWRHLTLRQRKHGAVILRWEKVCPRPKGWRTSFVNAADSLFAPWGKAFADACVAMGSEFCNDRGAPRGR